MDPGSDRQYLNRQYADSVFSAGGIPIMIPLVPDPRQMRPFADRLAGILLTGSSSDLDPKRYGAAREQGCGPTQPLRDEMDFTLLEVALQTKKPILAICFGMQSLNVFMGGTLIQDIPSTVESAIRHDDPESQGRPSHAVDILPGSILENLAGGIRAEVNSTHHQALDRVGSGLKVIARAPDGIIESVVVASEDQFVLGVQWHPEKSASFDAFSKKIFDYFVSRCRERASFS